MNGPVLGLASVALLMTIAVMPVVRVRRARAERIYHAQILKRLHEHVAVSPMPGPRKD